MIGLIAGGCAKPKETELVTFPLRGHVVAVDTAALTVTVAHQAIPNYMNAMTMPFHVKERASLRTLAPGDSVQATLAVSRTESWLEGISVAGKGPPPRTLSPEEITATRMFRTGDTLPDDIFLNQGGAKVRLSAFRGKALAITFIYTRCPLPDYCIRMSNQFAAVQRTLGRDPSLAGMWHLCSISFDPKFDRPGVLKRYAGQYGADFSTWDFLTDPDTAGTALRTLAEGLGLEYVRDEGLIDHNLRTAVIDREGKLVGVLTGNAWKPEQLSDELRSLMRGGAGAP